MRACDIPDSVVATVKRARALGYKYEVIASYFVLNQGRIADIMYERIKPEIPACDYLPEDFPALAA